METSKNLEIEYSDKTKNFMTAIRNYIIQTNGTMPSEYELSLRMLADDIELYLKSRAVCDSEGIVFKYQEKMYVNPVYKIMTEQQNAIMNILRQFGLTSFSRSKIKMQDNSQTAEQLIAALME